MIEAPVSLRVAVVAESFLPSVNGVARSVQHVVEHLERRGHRTLVIAPRPGDLQHHTTPVHRQPSIPLPRCRELPVGLPTGPMRAAIEDFRPDVVHLASPIVLGARAVTVARDLHVPTVAVYQTDVAGFAAQYGLGRAGPTLWRWLRRVHNAADRTLAPSRAAASDLRHRGIREVHPWPRGVDGGAFAPHHRRRAPTAEVGVVRVGYVGRLTAEKRVDRLIHLLDLPGSELVVVGDGSDRPRLQQLLPTARFTGQLRGAELSRAFADLDVFVHTGTNETFCQAAQEALASGVPVVAPSAGGLLDLVRHGRNGLFWDPLDEPSLRTAVLRLVGQPVLRARQAGVAREGVEGRSWEAVGDLLIDHYRAVLRDRAHAHLAA